MDKLIASGGAKRLLAMILAPVFAVVNKKFGIGLGETEVDAILAVIVFYIGQSAWKEQAIAKIDAAAPAPATTEASVVALKAAIDAEKNKMVMKP